MCVCYEEKKNGEKIYNILLNYNKLYYILFIKVLIIII